MRTSRGRIDAVVVLADAVFLFEFKFEFKLDGSEAEALAQIKENDYFRRYRGTAKPLMLVGINFSTTTRDVAGWLVAEQK